MLLSGEKIKEGIDFFRIWRRVEDIAALVPEEPFADETHAAFATKLRAFRWRGAYIVIAFVLLLIALISASLALFGGVLCNDGVATLQGCLTLP